jgi:hypothetical protein
MEGPFTLRVFDPLAGPPQPPQQGPPQSGGPRRFSLKQALRKCRKLKKKGARRRCIHRARRRAKLNA